MNFSRTQDIQVICLQICQGTKQKKRCSGRVAKGANPGKNSPKRNLSCQHLLYFLASDELLSNAGYPGHMRHEASRLTREEPSASAFRIWGEVATSPVVFRRIELIVEMIRTFANAALGRPDPSEAILGE